MPVQSVPHDLRPHQYLVLPPSLLAVAAVLMAAPVVLARRWPVTVLGLLVAGSVVSTVLRERPWPLFLASDTVILLVGAMRPARAALGALGGAVLVWAVESALIRTPWPLLPWEVGILTLGALVAWTVGNSIRQQRDHSEALRLEAAARAVVTERLRIARELHDMVAHSVGIIAIQAGMGARVIEARPDEARSALDAIETTSRETLAGLRRMMGGLRRADPSEAGVAPHVLDDISWLVASTARAGVHVEVEWRGRRRPLPADVELAAFRIVQEAVTNVVRHALAGRCRVALDFRERDLAIEIVDDGTGGETGSQGYGIAGMRERVSLLRGEFSAGPRPGGGFRVAARLPA
jgi:signal transduction histidine kinase